MAIYSNVLPRSCSMRTIAGSPLARLRDLMVKHDDTAIGGSALARKGLWRLMLKLPAMRGRLQIIAAKSAALRELCEAYEEASVTAERLSRQDAPVNPALLSEYRTICSEIENEVVQLVLEQSKAVPD